MVYLQRTKIKTMNINEQKKYVFKKAYESKQGTIPEGSEVVLFHGQVYFNGGMCTQFYQNMLCDMIADQKFRKEYLQEMRIINNAL